jgi:Abnormal spindle-like microcephaly-assoc'd, ASPM-SPD-2-Hydin
VQVQEQATPQTITVNGQSVTVPALSTSYACQLSGTPTSISFSNTTVGYMISSSASLTSNCTTTVTIDSVQSPGAPFSTSGFQTPFTLAPGQTQSYTAVFSPTATGPASGNIVFASTVSSVQPLTVSLTGTGVASTQGTLSSSPTTLGFGNVTVNSTQSQTATITNTGAASVSVSAVGVTGTGFTLNKVTTPFTIGVNQTAQLTVGFTPTATGSASGTLTITSNASNGTFAVPLTGTGVTHSVTLSWSDTAAQIAGYNVYRSTVSGGPYTRINSALDGTTSYTDSTVVSGTTYYYTVTAVGTNGAESAYSSQTAVTIP